MLSKDVRSAASPKGCGA